jgi:hypothetical protein
MVKIAFKAQSSLLHPDKHTGKSAAFIEVKKREFQLVNNANVRGTRLSALLQWALTLTWMK